MQARFRAKGFGLLEVLITSLVLSLGLMGVAVLQTKSAKLVNKARNASSASLLAHELASAMQANPLELSAGTYGAYYLILANNKQDSLDKSCNSSNSCFTINHSPGENSGYWWQSQTISARDCTKLECWPADLAVNDIITTRDKLQKELPNGRLSSFTENNGEFSLTISWDDIDGNTPSTTIKIPYSAQAFYPLTRVRQMPKSLYSDSDMPKQQDIESIPPNLSEPWFEYVRYYLDNIRRPPPVKSRRTVGIPYATDSMQIKHPFLSNNQLRAICSYYPAPPVGNGICDSITAEPATPDIEDSTSQNNMIREGQRPAFVNSNPFTDEPAKALEERVPEPIDGGWGDWGAWSGCSCTAGTTSGIQTRERACSNPAPQYGGAYCSGNGKDNISCTCYQCGPIGAWCGNIPVYLKILTGVSCSFFSCKPKYSYVQILRAPGLCNAQDQCSLDYGPYRQSGGRWLLF